jgi:NADPH:quinone reductase-like Zn-dependent oxidoreductase
MKAIVCTEYGTPDTLRVEEVPNPSPKLDEVLVKVHAASVNAADLEILRGEWPARLGGPIRPQNWIPGSDVAGRVEAVGRNVTLFQPGDEVWADLSYPYGYGAFAEYVCVSENAFAMKPASMTFEEASTYPQAAIIPLQSFRDKAKVRPGQKLLINGAGGGMGTFAVQLAKYYGAEVTAVDSAMKLDMLRSIGADHVIDYAQDDYTKSGQRYDLIIDVVANRSVFDYQRALNPEGMFMIVGGSWTTFLQILTLGTLISITGSKKLGLNAYDANNKEDLATLAELFESGDLLPVIDRRYSLGEVPEALQYLGEGSHLGKLVITADLSSNT